MDKPIAVILTVSSILFGFLFAGFWWTLNREISFAPEERHLKLGTGMLLASMIILGYFGIITPLRVIAETNPTLVSSYRGVLVALVVIYGYMFTELGHYSVFQRPKYVTNPEKVCFFLTLTLLAWVAVSWIMR